MKLVYFSPTGTTEAVARAIAIGFDPTIVEPVDITSPDARAKSLRTAEDELLLVAVPVYMGRVPALLSEWLNAMQAHGTPAVCVVVYGNRAYENALLELGDIVRKGGGIPVAAAAYIGEHSFADAQAPVGLGRPDAADLEHAEALGRSIREKLEAVESVGQISEVRMPGEYPYGGRTTLWDVDFIAVNDQCVRCGLCAEVCPVGAVDPEDGTVIDQVKCITCCACIKRCPQNARSMKPGPVMEARQRLKSRCLEPGTPEIFI